MTAAEIAETLLNGNIAQARHEICFVEGAHFKGAWSQESAVMTLDVLDELIAHASDGNDIVYMIAKLRRCLEGAS